MKLSTIKPIHARWLINVIQAMQQDDKRGMLKNGFIKAGLLKEEVTILQCLSHCYKWQRLVMLYLHMPNIISLQVRNSGCEEDCATDNDIDEQMVGVHQGGETLIKSVRRLTVRKLKEKD